MRNWNRIQSIWRRFFFKDWICSNNNNNNNNNNDITRAEKNRKQWEQREQIQISSKLTSTWRSTWCIRALCCCSLSFFSLSLSLFSCSREVRRASCSASFFCWIAKYLSIFCLRLSSRARFFSISSPILQLLLLLLF